MKIVNEKGKLFGIINIVDLLAVMFVLLVIGGVAWKVFGDQIADVTQSLMGQKEKVEYVVRISGADPDLYAAAVSFGFPQQLAINEGPVKGCYLTNIVPEASYITTTDSDGVTHRVQYDGRVDLVCYITAEVDRGDFIAVGSQEVRIGRTHIVKTQFFELSGTIIDLNADKAVFAPNSVVG